MINDHRHHKNSTSVISVGLSIGEIAERLGVSKQAVHQTLHTALRKMRAGADFNRFIECIERLHIPQEAQFNE